MRLNGSFIGTNPINGGYRLSFSVTDTDPLDFQNGVGDFFVYHPEIAITGMSFLGKENLYQTGITSLNDLNVVTNQIEIDCYISGDLDGETGKAIPNAKTMAIYSGADIFFQPDVIESGNLVNEYTIKTNKESAFVKVVIPEEDLQNRYDEVIFYKAIPGDYATYYSESTGVVSGSMFSGYATATNITTPQVEISRQTAKDFEFNQAQSVEIITGTTITIFSGVPGDFEANFRIRTNTEPITINSNGLDLISSVGGLSVSNNSATIPAGNEFQTFILSTINDLNGVPEKFIIDQ